MVYCQGRAPLHQALRSATRQAFKVDAERPTGGSLYKDLADQTTTLISTSPYRLTLKGNMTREFNKQRRDGSRPPFRNSSSSQPGDERSSRPARPRLNREMVDRAWENGATRTHADYHPRSSNGQSQSTSNNWRNNQRSGNSSQQTPGGRKPYGQGQDNYDRNNSQRSDRPYSNQQGPNSHSSSANRYNGNGADRPGIDSRRPFSGNPSNPRERQENRPPYERGSGNRPPYERGPVSRGPDNRPPYEHRPDNRPPYERGPVSRGPGSRPPYERGPVSRGPGSRPPYERGPVSRGPGSRPPYERGPVSRGPGNRPPYERGPVSRGPGNRPPYERGSAPRGPEGMAPGTRGAARYERPERDSQRGKNDSHRGNPTRPPQDEAQRPPNPRWLSRPEVRQARDVQRQQEHDEQFEGDYEQFDAQEASKRSEPVERGSNHRHSRNDDNADRHVTRLDDGRVLKGSRPAQRKNAQFWTEINEDTSKLVEQISLPDEDTSKPVEQITLPDDETDERVEQVKLPDDEPGTDIEQSDEASQTAAPAAKKSRRDGR